MASCVCKTDPETSGLLPANPIETIIQVEAVTDSLKIGTVGDEESTPRRIRRNWPVLILSLLLFFQSLSLFFVGGLYTLFIEFDWVFSTEDYLVNIPLGLRGGVLIAIGLLAFLAAIGFLRLWPGSWLNAVMAQGTSLLIMLFLYFHERPFYIYLFMVFNIFMIIYLNYSEVKESFQSQRTNPQWNELDEH